VSRLHPALESASNYRQRIESSGQRIYSDPLRMTNFIAKKNFIAPASGHHPSLAEASAICWAPPGGGELSA
jgi:hypothetical protein